MDSLDPHADGGRLHFSESQRRSLVVPAAHMPDAMGRLYQAKPIHSKANPRLHRSLNWVSSDYLLVRTDGAAYAARKTAAQIENGAHLICVSKIINGYSRGRAVDTVLDRHPGAIHVLDQAHPIEKVQTPLTSQCIFLPKNAVGFDPDKHAILQTFPIDRPVGRLLDYLLSAVFKSLLEDNTLQIGALNEFLACLKLALNPRQQNTDARTIAGRALKRQMESHIERNIGDWDLSVSTLLRTFGVSRASLYRMFEDRGGVRNYIWERRILRAILDLSKQELRRGDIADVAEKWGFSSSANFNRAVRNEFGVAPGTLVNIPEPDRLMLPFKSEPKAFGHWANNAFERISRLKQNAAPYPLPTQTTHG